MFLSLSFFISLYLSLSFLVSNEKNSLLATEGAAHFWLDKDFYYIEDIINL
jgi:hypothetical protein